MGFNVSLLLRLGGTFAHAVGPGEARTRRPVRPGAVRSSHESAVKGAVVWRGVSDMSEVIESLPGNVCFWNLPPLFKQMSS